MLPSLICRTDELESPEFRGLAREMHETPSYHRKQWEYCYITRVLQERGKLTAGMRGLGFAVGKEPLTALFARYGASVLATDLAPDDSSGVVASWQTTAQHAGSLKDLNERNICPASEFARLVRFAFVDMNRVPNGLTGFDFLWSACAIEHVGGLDMAKAAFVDMMKCLKPGGIAIHTTEFNVLSNDETIETGPAIIWRKRDLEELGATLHERGHHLVPPDLRLGTQFADHYVDEEPFKHVPHLKLRLGGFVATSVGLIAIAGVPPGEEPPANESPRIAAEFA